MSIETILRLADRLPTGRHDPKAAEKFAAEMREFEDEIRAGKREDAATEMADLVYYWCKMSTRQRLLHLTARLRAERALGVSSETAFRLCEAKYELRARPGNPKDKDLERRRCARILQNSDDNPN